MTDIFWKLYLQQLTAKVCVWHFAVGLVVLAYYEKAISVKTIFSQCTGVVFNPFTQLSFSKDLSLKKKKRREVVHLNKTFFQNRKIASILPCSKEGIYSSNDILGSPNGMHSG